MPSPSRPGSAPEPAAPLTRAALERDLRERAFAPGPHAPRLGAEVELIPVCAASGRVLPIHSPGEPSSLPLLRRHAERAGWTEGRTPGGSPLFHTPGGGFVSYEPGGQIEYSSPPLPSVGALVAALHAVVLPLRRAAEDAGAHLLAVGIDPGGAAEPVPLQLQTERYSRMAAYFARIGPAGAMMMRQTASFQVNLDWGDDPPGRWRLLNAAAPLLAAVFANSPLYRGAPAGARSVRGLVWRELDPARTGLAGRTFLDPAAEYLDFALRAPAMLLPWPDGRALPFAEWLARGDATEHDWQTHLTTLFPEVRPKGFAELRSLDALEPRWYAVPLVLLAGLAYHRPTLMEALRLLPAPDPALLRRAALCGLADPALAGTARDLFQLALRGAAALGEEFADAAALEAARDFYERYTRLGRSPADDALPPPRLPGALPA